MYRIIVLLQSSPTFYPLNIERYVLYAICKTDINADKSKIELIPKCLGYDYALMHLFSACKCLAMSSVSVIFCDNDKSYSQQISF